MRSCEERSDDLETRPLSLLHYSNVVASLPGSLLSPLVVRLNFDIIFLAAGFRTERRTASMIEGDMIQTHQNVLTRRIVTATKRVEVFSEEKIRHIWRTNDFLLSIFYLFSLSCLVLDNPFNANLELPLLIIKSHNILLPLPLPNNIPRQHNRPNELPHNRINTRIILASMK